MAEDHIPRSFTVAVPAERAFHAFTADFVRWWPAEYTWSGAVLQWIGMEPHTGGACYELGPEGFRCDFGRVLLWQPPHRLRFSWQIGPTRVPEPDPARASEVEVRFLAETPDRTRVELEHRHFSRHGSGAREYRAAMDSPQGWDHILHRYARALT
jgi:uncharacterized protein YndB with AHSA1/START domain